MVFNFMEKERIKHEIENALERLFGVDIGSSSERQIYKAMAFTVREKLLEKWVEERKKDRGKTLYYLSFEFLVGRLLSNNLINLGLEKAYKEVAEDFGIDWAKIVEIEPDAGLGNGGLGRLAACYMDSLATLNFPAYGCGIRYEYGLFKQRIVDGYQIELPDPWLEDGCVWEVEHPEDSVEIHFGGSIEEYYENDKMKTRVNDTTKVLAVPYDMPIVGFNGEVVNTLRLWSAKSPKTIDMAHFSSGAYTKAIEEKELAELLSKVLYPEDNHLEGKNLRLRQQYFFTSATLQWMINSLKKQGKDLHDMPNLVAVHINDTHPAIAIPELMRLLLDNEGFSWDEAYSICKRVFAYTNHTVMAEALEHWGQEMFRQLLPRIYQIIEEIHKRNEEKLVQKFGEDWGKINYMDIMAHNQISMANLCLSTCHSVNGVAELHTDILKKDIFRDYYALHPKKFKNVTNGVAFRRWLNLANPDLYNLILKTVGDIDSDPLKLEGLVKYADDKAFQEKFMKIKRQNKVNLSNYVLRQNGIMIDPDSIYDSQTKRLHEYKRQLLNILHILMLYFKIKDRPHYDMHPHTFIFSAKAAPGYGRAKMIIKLINSVAEMINKDPQISERIKIVFLENYGVSLAQKIIPATDVSEQISTAGKEASGTGNMKFMLNGAVTIGTLDGANVEMKQLVGKDNIYIFGLKAEEVARIYASGNNAHSKEIYSSDAPIRRVLDSLVDGTLSPDKPQLFSELYQSLIFGDNNFPDPYMVLQDFVPYAKAHKHLWEAYRDKERWAKMAITNTAMSGHFSSDRCIAEYNEKIWKLR